MTTHLHRLVFTAACMGLAAAPITHAHDLGEANDAYVGDADSHLITDGSGNCVQTGSASTGNDLVDCGAEPVETARAVAPAVMPAPVVESVAEAVTLSGNALFGFDSNELSDSGKAELDTLAAKLTAMDSVDNVHIAGHTDSQGASAYNQMLSERRAVTVKNYLASQGIPADRISTDGMGESSPVASNASADGRALNRRVEISIKGKQLK